MIKSVVEFRKLFLIHSLKRLPDGSYVALDRRYRPLGFTGSERVDYEAMTWGRFKFKRALSAAQVAALSFDGDTSAAHIYLYNDTCVPTASAAHWRAYSARLERLAGYRIVEM